MARLPLCAPADALFALLLPGESTNGKRHALEPTTDTDSALVIEDTARTPLTGGGKPRHP